MEGAARELASYEPMFRSDARRIAAFSTGTRPLDVYASACLQKIARIGNINYPSEARGRFYGKVSVSFEIRASGEIRDPEVVRSSGYGSLDAAIVKAVKLSSPCASFPEEVRKIADVVFVARTFEFAKANSLESPSINLSRPASPESTETHAPRPKGPSLGVIISNVSPEFAKRMGLSKPSGAVIASVESGSTAERAGIEKDDIILRIGNEEIKTVTDLVRVIKTLSPGDNVAVEVHRQKTRKSEELTVEVAERSN